ncbi:MAG TPA: hypothetical protein DDY78_07065 [Planctomycetales bacterium]|jgi:hypothetical protein|nr:hypothetical protein [Planctomycetales bacterium]
MFYVAPADSNASATPYDVVMQFTQALKLTTAVSGRMCNSRQQCLKELESLFDLQDDWDGEGSAAPDPVNVRSAKRLLELAYQSGNFPSPPQIAPGGNGEVILAWREGDLYLEAELVALGKVEWMLAGPDRQTNHWVTELPVA